MLNTGKFFHQQMVQKISLLTWTTQFITEIKEEKRKCLNYILFSNNKKESNENHQELKKSRDNRQNETNNSIPEKSENQKLSHLIFLIKLNKIKIKTIHYF